MKELQAKDHPKCKQPTQKLEEEVKFALRQWPPTILAPGTCVMENNFSMDQDAEDGLGRIQVHFIYCALYFCYHYISSTSDHQALGSRGWGPLP